MGPGFLGVDKIAGNGRNPAKIICTSGEELAPAVSGGWLGMRVFGRWCEVGWRLNAHFRTEEQPCHSDCPQQLVERRLGGGCHGCALLGPEVLDDDLLHGGRQADHMMTDFELGETVVYMLAPLTLGIMVVVFTNDLGR